MFLVANGVVISVTVYFFLKVLRTGTPPDEPEEEANFPRGG